MFVLEVLVMSAQEFVVLSETIYSPWTEARQTWRYALCDELCQLAPRRPLSFTGNTKGMAVYIGVLPSVHCGVNMKIRQEDTFPLIARIISQESERLSRSVHTREIVGAMLLDRKGRRLVRNAAGGSDNGWSLNNRASYMV